MYEEFFGLTQEPFPKNILPEEMYETNELKEMEERLRDGINKNELVILISEPGCGKNTLLRRLHHENSTTLFIYINGLNTNTRKFYRDTLQQMGIDIGYYQADIKELVKKQLGRLHSEGRKVCMVIDEAQALRINLLHEAQYLMNESYDSESYLSIILCGLPRLWTKLSSVLAYSAIEDRLAIGCSLHPLTQNETKEYIQYSLKRAGCTRELFSESAYKAIYENSKGRMRRINRLCKAVLMYAGQNKITTINDDTIHFLEQHEMLCTKHNETNDNPLSD